MNKTQSAWVPGLLAIFAAASTSLAQPVVNEKALPKGVTVKDATVAAEAAKKAIKVRLDKQMAALKSAKDAANKSVAPVATKLKELATSDKEFAAFMATQKELSSSKAAESSIRLKEHYKKNRSLFDRVYKLAGGDLTKNRSSILLALQRFQPTLEHLADALLAITTPPETSNPNPIGSKIQFTAPYAIHDTSLEQGGPGVTDPTATISNTTAEMTLHAFAMGGLCSATAEAMASTYVDVPAGMSSMTVQILYNHSDKVTAGAAGLALSDAIVLAGIQVQEFPSNAPVGAELRFEVDSVVAVAFWFAERENERTDFTTQTVPVTGGKRYLVTFAGVARATAANSAWAEANLVMTPTQMEFSFQ